MSKYPLNIYKLRSSFQVVEIALKYLARNIKGLYGSLTLYSLTLIILAVIICLRLGLPVKALENIYPYRDLNAQHLFIPLVGAFIVRLVGITLHNQIISRHIIQSNNEEDTEGINYKSVITYLKNDFVSVFMIYLFLTFMMYLINWGYEYLVGAAKSDSGGFSDSLISLFSSVLDSAAGWLPYFFFFPILQFFYIAVLFVAIRDKANITEALSTTWEYCKDRLKNVWMASLLFLIVTYLVYYITNTTLGLLFFWLPGTLSSWSGTNSETWFSTYLFISLICKYFIMSLYQAMVIIYFGNLVELRDETTIKKQLDSI